MAGNHVTFRLLFLCRIWERQGKQSAQSAAQPGSSFPPASEGLLLPHLDQDGGLQVQEPLREDLKVLKVQSLNTDV